MWTWEPAAAAWAAQPWARCVEVVLQAEQLRQAVSPYEVDACQAAWVGLSSTDDCNDCEGRGGIGITSCFCKQSGFLCMASVRMPHLSGTLLPHTVLT